MQRFWLFFYDLPNIFGLACLLMALIGYVVFAVMGGDFISALVMLFVVLLAYPLGWLLGFLVRKPEAVLQFQQTLTAEQITDELNRLLKKVHNRISPEAYEHLQNIQSSILSVLPQLVAGRFGDQDLFTIKKTVFDYLPTTLENYLKLPSAYASMHVIQEGKTAKVLLTEQLTLIDTSMQQVVHNIYNNDAQDLLVNQRFLESRLNEVSFLSYAKCFYTH